MCEDPNKFYVLLASLYPVCDTLQDDKTAILSLGTIIHDVPLQLLIASYVFGVTCTVISSIVVHVVADLFTISTQSKALSQLSYLI